MDLTAQPDHYPEVKEQYMKAVARSTFNVGAAASFSVRDAVIPMPCGTEGPVPARLLSVWYCLIDVVLRSEKKILQFEQSKTSSDLGLAASKCIIISVKKDFA